MILAAVCGTPPTYSGNGHHSLKKRLVLLYGLIHGVGSTHVLHHHPGIDGQAHRGHLTAGDSVDELLLTALRIFLLQRNHLYLRIGGGGQPTHGLYGGWLIVLYADIAFCHAQGLHHDTGAQQDLFGMLDHQAVVGGQVRLALGSVYNQEFGLLSRRGRQLDMGREGSTAHTHYAAIGDSLYTL